MDVILTCFLCVIGALAIWLGWKANTVLKRLDRAVYTILDLGMEASVELGHIVTMRKSGEAMMAQAKEYLDVPPSMWLMDAGIQFFAHIGAQDLGKNGLGLDKEQASRVVMARNGFNVAGKRLGDGLGVPEIVEKFGGVAGMMGGGGGGSPIGDDGQINLGGLLMNFLMGGFGGGSAPPGSPPGHNQASGNKELIR